MTCEPEASVPSRRTINVVGSGRWVSSLVPSAVTGPASSRDPLPRCSGPFGHRRKTSRSVGRFGVNVTVKSPVTIRNGRVTRTFNS